MNTDLTDRPAGAAGLEPVASRFLFVSGRYEGSAPAISCDGLVPGSSLQLTHWEGNDTPERFRADTSTEIALLFVQSEAARRWDGAVVVNNHFDTDGILAVWTLLAPGDAVARRDRIVAAAEVGDFEEWPADPRALRIDAALRALGDDSCDDASAYSRALSSLPALLDEIDERADLWGAQWSRLEEAERDLDAGRIRLERRGEMAVARHAPGIEEVPGPLLSREVGGARRILLAFETSGGLFHYRYERPRYAWAVTVRRPAVRAPDAAAMAARLGGAWSTRGAIGMTAILATDEPISADPASAAESLQRAEAGL